MAVFQSKVGAQNRWGGKI